MKIEEELNEKYCPECSNGEDKSEMWGSDEEGYVCPFCGYEIEGNKIETKEVEITAGVYL